MLVRQYRTTVSYMQIDFTKGMCAPKYARRDISLMSVIAPEHAIVLCAAATEAAEDFQPSQMQFVAVGSSSHEIKLARNAATQCAVCRSALLCQVTARWMGCCIITLRHTLQLQHLLQPGSTRPCSPC